jgi:hypothetical protein
MYFLKISLPGNMLVVEESSWLSCSFPFYMLPFALTKEKHIFIHPERYLDTLSCSVKSSGCQTFDSKHCCGWRTHKLLQWMTESNTFAPWTVSNCLLPWKLRENPVESSVDKSWEIILRLNHCVIFPHILPKRTQRPVIVKISILF